MWVSVLACVPFVINHVLLKKFLLTPTQASLAFWIWLVQVKGTPHGFGGGVKLGCGPVWAKQGQKNVGTRVVREWSPENIHIFHFRVFEPLKELFCMKCFNTDQVQLDSRVWPSSLNWGSYCQDVYNPIMLWDKYHNMQGYFVVECMNVLHHSWSYVVSQNLWCAFQNSILPMCMYKVHVCISKITVFLVTDFIYDKINCSELLVCI